MKRIWLLAVLALLLCMTQTALAIRPVAIGDVVHKGGGVYDVRAYGATGDGSTDDYAAVNSAATAAAGNTLEFKAGTYVIGTNITIDEDAFFYKGAIIKPSNGITVTLTGAITAGPYQTFDESASGVVSISNGMANEVLPQWWNGAVIQAFTDADATPSVKKGRMFATANTAPATITMFDDGISGQVIRVFIGDGNTTFDFTSTNLKGNGGADWTAADGDALIAGFDGTDWYCMVSDPVGSPTTADKDLVSGTGLTGGEDNVLVGADSDLTLNVVAGDGVIANADEVEVYGFVASDGTPNDAAVTDADGDVTFNYNITVDGITTFTTSAAQAITAVGDTILANATRIELNPDANYTLTSTPHIADGTKGDILIITAANAEGNTVTLQDQDTLGGSNVELGATTRGVTGKSVLVLAFDGSDWIEVNYGAAGLGDILKDLVAGNGLTGGADDVFPGADADVTVAVGAGDGVIANANEIEVYGLVASDGDPNDAATTAADGDVTVKYGLVLPQATDPTTDEEGKVAWDSNNDALEVYDGSASRLISTLEDGEVTIIAPDGVNDQIPIFHVDADKYPFGIKLVNVQITIPSDGAYSMVFEEWSGDPAAAQNDIETVTTGAGDSYMEVLTGDIDDSDIDADDYIFLDIPATDIDWIQCKFIYYIKEGN
jgi:hypothetical protein